MVVNACTDSLGSGCMLLASASPIARRRMVSIATCAEGCVLRDRLVNQLLTELDPLAFALPKPSLY